MKHALAVTLTLLVLSSSAETRAFTHIVKPGETLAQIAERVYGNAKLETVLVGANALDVEGGSVIAPGMRLEIPAPGHHRVARGEGWSDLALSWLGTDDIARADLLAKSNKGVAWVPPTEGQEIEIPAVVTYIAMEGDTVNTIASKFWGDPNRGWELNPYNARQGLSMKRGEIVLVPMPELKLTEAGKSEARAAAERDGATAGNALDQQRRAEADLAELAGDLRAGKYVQVVARGNRILMMGALTHPQLAAIHRALLEAYVALDDAKSASEACTAWKTNEPGASLDPARVSPKIVQACAR